MDHDLVREHSRTRFLSGHLSLLVRHTIIAMLEKVRASRANHPYTLAADVLGL